MSIEIKYYRSDTGTKVNGNNQLTTSGLGIRIRKQLF